MPDTKIKPGEHKSISTEFKKGVIPHNKGKKTGPLSNETKKRIKAAVNKHHVDLNRDNNSLDNCLFLTLKDHRRLHARAYDYLVELGLIDDYIEWYKGKYNPKIFTLEEYLSKLSRGRKYSEGKLMRKANE